MNLYNLILAEVDAGNVNVSRTGNLSIFKYTRDCVYEDRWNEVNRLCRGIIFDDKGTLLARPFPKFFNMDERPETAAGALPWRDVCSVWEKVDGSCGILYRPPGGSQARLATPGSMESEQAERGTEILHSQYSLKDLPDGVTPIFEIVYPENRIVVDYGDQTFLSLLSVFNFDGTEWSPSAVDDLAKAIGCRRPRRYDYSPNSGFQIPFEDNSEGYVIRFGNGFRVKVKSPEYVKIHSLLSELSYKNILEMVRENQYNDVVKQLPEHLRENFDDIYSTINSQFRNLRQEAENLYANLRNQSFPDDPREARKAMAGWIQSNSAKHMWPAIFQMLDGRDTSEYFWDYLKRNTP